MNKKIVGIIGSGLIGEDPFDRQSWSGSSYFFFRECERQGILHRAFGAELPPVKRATLMALNFSPNRRKWQSAYYMDPRYKRALTALIATQLQADDFRHYLLQIGAMYNVPQLANGRTLCFSYHDGNLAYSQRSPYAVKELSPKAVERGLAYEREVYDGLTMMFTMSEHLRQSFIEDFHVPPERVKAVGAGINIEHLPDPAPDKDYSRKDILFIGVEFDRKGGWELLKAFRKVRQGLPEACLHIVGPRTLEIPSELASGVQYHGFLRKTDPADAATLTGLFRDCSLFVMPSLYEPFGIAPLEAMIYQVPCVVTNGWGLKETVIEGQTGGLVECGSVDDLADKLLHYLGDPERLRRMGEQGRSRVLEYYTWPKVIKRMNAHIQAAGSAKPAA
jgi:starch synthase